MVAASMRTRGGCSSSEDRLSTLPDVLLHSILSFLKARQVVQTSVLARRWKNLWRSVPCIHMDQKEFSNRRGLLFQRELEKFEDFGDFLLLHRDRSVLDTFRLTIRESDPEPTDAYRWIRRALNCFLKALHIDSDHICELKMPLDLGPSSYRLTKLHLCNISLDEEFEDAVSSVFVLLEDLELKGCEIHFDEISSTTLRSLIMVGNDFESNELIITAPHLASLHLEDITVRTSLNEMLSLAKALIHSEVEEPEIIELLGNLYNVTSLELSGFYEKVVSDVEPAKLPRFKNLRTLLLDNSDLGDRFQLLRLFLENSPNLEKLTVRYCKLPEVSVGGEGRANFKCQKLRSTEIVYTRYSDIRELVCFLLDISGHGRKNTITLTQV